LYVTHDFDDGAWQFLPGSVVSTDDSAIISLEEAVAIDPSIQELNLLPLGSSARRESINSNWILSNN